MALEKRPIHANSVHCTYKNGIAEGSPLRKICNAFFSFFNRYALCYFTTNFLPLRK